MHLAEPHKDRSRSQLVMATAISAMVSVAKPRVSSFAFVSRYALAIVFAVNSLAFIGVMAIQMPPYQNPDETNHFFRAEQISRLGLMPEQLPDGVGGAFVDVGIVETAVPFLSIPLHPERKATSSLYDVTRSVGWGRQLTQVAFPNTIIYPPTLYLPSVAGIWIGKLSGRSVVQTLYLSRIVNGVCATIIATLAIALAEGAALWLFAMLTLPMTMALFSAVSQDGLMIACAALATAIVAKARHTKLSVSDRRFAVLFLALMAICMAKPPYIPLAGLVLMTRWRSPRLRAVSVVLIAAAVISWSLIALDAAGLNVTASHSDPKRQFYDILAHPFKAVAVLGRTYDIYGVGYLEQIVGRLGHLDVALPGFIQVAAWAALIMAAMQAIAQAIHQKSLSAKAFIATFLCMAACVLLIDIIQYLTFSSVSRITIEGIQGRYFIEIIMILPIFAYGSKPVRNSEKYVYFHLVLTAIVYVPVTTGAILQRYYL